MDFKLKVYTIQELGGRPNQEDALFPKHGKASENDRLFILCDGMGGHEAGEIASQTVCDVMSYILSYKEENKALSDELIQTSISQALDALDDKDTGAAKKMGTTMTLLCLHNQGYTIAHIGDSRVYHIRPGVTKDETKILHKTEDHSLVNYLVKAGQLTPEEAKHSSKKNIITRAMQPHLEHRPQPEIYHSSDIISGDYFYLCSDGMLEEMDDENLRFIFSEKIPSGDEKVKILVQNTQTNKDNHSAIIVHITNIIDTSRKSTNDDGETVVLQQESKFYKLLKNLWLPLTIFLLSVAFIIMLLYLRH